ncbi:MAG: acyltransferase [Chitinophagales bacterium]|nr:acyltransferase [Chitinophagales bacterium]
MSIPSAFSDLFRYHKRVIGLDLLRFIAVFYIFWGHGIILIPNEWKEIYSIPIYLPFEGVSVFFVLSGFLIGNILLRTLLNKTYSYQDLKTFWVRRWYRTLPNYYFILMVLIVLTYPVGSYVFSYFIFSQNLLQDTPDLFTVSWSLAIEEWFYLLFPLLLFIVYRITGQKLHSLLVCVFLFLICPLAGRLYFFYHPDHSLQNLVIRKAVFLRLDSMMYGIIGSIISTKFPIWWNRYKFHCLLTSAFLLVGYLIVGSNSSFSSTSGIYQNVFVFNYEAITVLLLLPFLSKLNDLGFSALNKAIVFISKISYSVYLVHGSVVLWHILRQLQAWEPILQLRFEVQRGMLFLLYLVLTLFLSVLMYLFIETPFMQWRDQKHKD